MTKHQGPEAFLFEKSGHAAVGRLAVITRRPDSAVLDQVFAADQAGSRQTAPALVEGLGAPLELLGSLLRRAIQTALRSPVALEMDLPSQMGKLQMDLGIAAVGENGIDLSLRVGIEGFDLGTLGDEPFQAAIASIDGIGFQQLIRIAERPLEADPRVDQAGQDAQGRRERPCRSKKS